MILMTRTSLFCLRSPRLSMFRVTMIYILRSRLRSEIDVNLFFWRARTIRMSKFLKID
ncbi:hypothetical protein BCEP4_2310011 [Burkholderia cepacia]|nr:hypothetical protein BCEP4_2310011 [Burkholderia cepacia]